MKSQNQQELIQCMTKLLGGYQKILGTRKDLNNLLMRLNELFLLQLDDLNQLMQMITELES